MQVKRPLFLCWIALFTAFLCYPPARAESQNDEDWSVDSMDSVDGEALNAHVEALRASLESRPKANLASSTQVTPTEVETTAPTDRDSFCKRTSDSAVVMNLASSLDNLTGFDNNGGLFNATGVCWWHSRLQRSALYLTVFHPEKPAPTEEREIHRIFKTLQHNQQVVEINGYANWNAFSTAWQKPLQKYLNRWQLGDVFIRQAWINGILNRAHPTGTKAADRLKKLVQNIAIEVAEKKRITFVKLNMKFPESHAWLIVGATPLPDGVDLIAVDSNYTIASDSVITVPGAFTYHYKYGQESFNMLNADIGIGRNYLNMMYGDFNPFVQHRGDFNRIESSIQDYCGPSASKSKTGK